MGLTQSQLNQAFPGNVGGITQSFGSNASGLDPQGEAGIDVGYAANAPVTLISSGTFVGSVAGGYADIFKSDVSGLYEYYQHIDSVQGLKIGTDYPVGTQIGVVDPRGSPGNSTINANGFTYYSSGPHLEFGLATGPPLPGAGYPSFSYVNPIQTIINDISPAGMQKDLIGSDQGLNLTTNQPQSPEQQIKNINQPTVSPNQLPQAILGTLVPSGLGSVLVLAGLGLAAIVLVYALVKGGTNVNVNGNSTGNN